MRVLPVAAAVLTGIQVGAALVATSFVIDQTTPALLALLRYFIGFLCLAPVVLMTSRRGFALKDILPISVLGFFQFGVLIILLNYAVQFIPVAEASLLFSTFPLQTLVMAVLFGRESFTARKIVGILLTILGVGFSFGPALLNSGQEIYALAYLSAAGSAFIGALCSLLYKPYLEKYPALNVSSLAMAASVVSLFFYTLFEGSLSLIPLISEEGWFAILFIGASSGGAFFAWLWALHHLPATNVTIFLSLGPVTSAILGAVFLGQALTLTLLISIVLVIFGLAIALRHKSGE